MMQSRLTAALLMLLAAVAIVAWSAPTDDGDGRPPISRGLLADDDVQRIRDEVLRRTNRDRDDEGLGPVEWDDKAAEVADAFCSKALADDSVGHFTTDGLSPLDRWGLAGGMSYVRENACTWGWSGPSAEWTLEKVLGILDGFQDAMLAETPPNDGHRQTILDPHVTHVGAGLAVSKNAMRYAQEFTARYVEFDPQPPTECGRSDAVRLVGQVSDPAAYRVSQIMLYFKERPEPIDAQETRSRMTYGLPERSRMLRPMLPEGSHYLNDGSQGDFHYGNTTGRFACSLPWFEGEGWYAASVALVQADAVQGTRPFLASWVLIRVGDKPEGRSGP